MASNSKEDRAFVGKLRHAVSGGDILTARRLIKGGVNISSTLWFDGTLLHEAVTSGKEEMVKLLVSAKADVNKTNEDGRSPLHFACRLGNMAIVRTLLDAKSDVNMETKDHKTPLHVALWRNHAQVAHELILAGANVNKQDIDGWSPLHWAATEHSLRQTVEELVDNGAKLNQQDKSGFTPLHQSLKNGNWETTCYLLKHGADPNFDGGSNFRSLPHSFLYNLLHHEEQMTKTHLHTLRSAGLRFTDNCKVIENKPKDYNTLLQLCRTCIRKRLNEVQGGRSILRHIKQLEIPTLMCDHLALKEEMEEAAEIVQ